MKKWMDTVSVLERRGRCAGVHDDVEDSLKIRAEGCEDEEKSE